MTVMVEEHINLVHFICHKHFRGVDEYEDVAGEGMVALAIAAQRFDPSRGINFSTFAYPWVRGSIQRKLKDTDRHGIRYSRTLDPEDRPLVRLLSEPLSEDELITLEHQQSKVEDYSGAVVEDFLRTLTDKQRQACRLKMAGWMQKEIATALGISQPQVSRIIATLGRKYRKWEGRE